MCSIQILTDTSSVSLTADSFPSRGSHSRPISAAYCLPLEGKVGREAGRMRCHQL